MSGESVNHRAPTTPFCFSAAPKGGGVPPVTERLVSNVVGGDRGFSIVGIVDT